MTLIRDGIGICDGDRSEDILRQEGWFSPLSRQTQESVLQAMVKHPRTALGLTEAGKLVMLVYSGRTRYSVGADYREMIQLARQLYPNIRQLINLDGGSSVLGLVVRGSLIELSVPAPSAGSCTGMVRPVKTMLHIPIE